MTPERLAEIKDLIEWYRKRESIGLSPGTMLPELVAEVERLQAEIYDLVYASGEAADIIFRLENEVERLKEKLRLGE